MLNLFFVHCYLIYCFHAVQRDIAIVQRAYESAARTDESHVPQFETMRALKLTALLVIVG